MKRFNINMDILDEIVFRTVTHLVEAESKEEAIKKVVKFHREGRTEEGVCMEEFDNPEYECFSMDYFKKIVSGENDYIYPDTIEVMEIPSDIDVQLSDINIKIDDLNNKIQQLKGEKFKLEALKR